MDAPEPGHFWKTPFLWRPRADGLPSTSALSVRPAERAWLLQAVAEVMADSADESDHAAVAELGAANAAAELLDVPADHFEVRAPWWLRAEDNGGEAVGFLLLALLRPQSYRQDGRTQGTICYMGVLPGHRGRGHAARSWARRCADSPACPAGACSATRARATCP